MTELDLHLVHAAAARLDGVAHRTPVLTSRTLDERTAGTVLCKAENLQRTGTFKFRGAYNVLAALDDESRTAGVCTVSSGNHAQALALSAQLWGVPAVILMPTDAPASKQAAVRDYGAEVVLYDRYSMPQWQAGEQLRRERGYTFVSSHDDPVLSAGAGTAALELIEDSGTVDVLVAPVGGGGGMAGYATVVRALNPAARIVAVEPASSGLVAASLAAQARVERPIPRTMADGLQLTRLGATPFEVISRLVDEVVQVTEDEITTAMTFLFERMKTVVEPSGAVALAAVLAGKTATAGARTGVILSGGNVSADRFTTLLAGAELR